MFCRTRIAQLLTFLLMSCVLSDLTVEAQTKQNVKSKLTKKQAQDLLRSGYDALQTQQHEDAVTAFSKALQSGKLNRDEIAKAFFYRGRANYTLKKPANAISDLTSALWLKDALSDKDRAEAIKMRKSAYQASGVETASMKTARAASARQISSWQAQQSVSSSSEPQASTSSGGSTAVTSFFNNLFGANQGQQPVAPSSTSASVQAPPSWATSTRTVPNTDMPKRVGSISGAYVIQVASVRSADRARNIAQQISAQHANLLNGRQPAVETQVIGNMGTFYHVRIRRWPSKQSSSELCKKLLASGLDCLVTN